MKKCSSKATRSADEQDGRANSNYSTERSPRTALLQAAKENVVLPLIQQAAASDLECRTERSIQE
jgi:hypothetical protein